MATKKNSWGFDVRELDSKIRPQDDFYHHVHKKWMDANPIPKSESRWGPFLMLRYDTDKKLRALLVELENKRSLLVNSPERLARDFYRSGMDMKRRNERGVSPLSPLLEKIEKIKTMDDLLRMVALLHRLGVGVLWGAGVDQDSKNSERYALHLAQDGLGLPDRDYYLKDDAESKRIMDAYSIHVEKLFKLMGRSPKTARDERDTVLWIETRLAEASMPKEDMRDPDKTYHKLSRAQLKRLAPLVNWELYLTQTQGSDAKTVIVMQPKFIEEVNAMIDAVPLAQWKTYLAWHLVNDYSGALSSSFIQQSFSFYGKVLSGSKTLRPLWRRVLGVVNGGLGEIIGQLYVKKHFTAQAKQRMDAMVDDLFVSYESRLRSLTWMTQATKRKALLKLRALRRKVGYPDKWKSYAGLRIEQDDYVGNIMRSNEFEHRREMKKLKKAVDRNEWYSYPQTVNAFYNPNMNDMLFPAAILQPPFFDMHADDAVNYGCMGMVIGHEITHGFDDEGSKFDAKGNLKSWWTPEDKERFEGRAKKVEKQFNAYKVADGIAVNGKLTLGENIADLGGLSIAYDAYQLHLERTSRTDIEGLTPEQRFFIAFSVFERENIRPELEKMAVLTDPHSPAIYRINGPLSNFTPFYEAYGVKKGHTLYREPEEREMVW